MAEELYRSTSQYHDITVNDEDGVTTLRIGGVKQTAVDAQLPLDARQPYLDFLHLVFAVQPEARRVLCIGLGGGVFPKRVWADRPDVIVDVVELDAEVVDVARRFFGLPEDERLRVHVDDGRAFIERTGDSYDVIVVDAYFGARMPYALVTREFMECAAARLSHGGVLAYNMVGALSGEGREAFDRFLGTLQSSLPSLLVFPVGVDCGGGRENIVVLATSKPVDRGALAERIAHRVGGSVRVDGFEAFGERLIDVSVPQGVAPLVDSDAPEDGMLAT